MFVQKFKILDFYKQSNTPKQFKRIDYTHEKFEHVRQDDCVVYFALKNTAFE